MSLAKVPFTNLAPFVITMCYKVIPKFCPACSIVRYLVHGIYQLLEPRCPLLGHIFSIIGGTVDDTSIPNDIKSILFHPPQPLQIILSSEKSVSAVKRH